MEPKLWIQLLIHAVTILLVFGAVAQSVPFMVLLERILIARMQQRVGPNRVGLDFIPGLGWLKGKFIIGGILQTIIDGLKLFLKEEVHPAVVDKTLHALAPLLTVVPAIFVLAIVPFGPPIMLTLGGADYPITLGITDLSIGLLFYLAVTGIGVYGIVIAGWASNSKYSLLGGLRSSAQMLSYEISMGLSIIGVLLVGSSFQFRELISQQSGGIWDWNVLKQPVGFLLFLVAGFAESNRLPFDLPEGESELGGGFHTEYSSMKFAMFFMAEYMNMFTFSAVITTLFLGGYHGPFPIFSELIGNLDMPLQLGPIALAGIASAILGIFWFSVKVFILICFMVFIRGTLPRFRYDQLMDLGWKLMFPVALVNLIVTAGIMTFAAPLQPTTPAAAPTGPLLTLILLGFGVAQIVIVDQMLNARRKRVLRNAVSSY